MDVSGETVDEDLRSRMQNNIKLCEQFAAVMKGNVTIRMAMLASQLSSVIVNAFRGEPFDFKILNELSQLLFEDIPKSNEHACVVLALKNIVLLAKLSVRFREGKAESMKRVALKKLSYEEKGDQEEKEEEEEEQSTNDGLSHRNSTKRVKSERTSLITKNTPVKRMSLRVKKTDKTPSKKVLDANVKMVDQARSLIRKKVCGKRMMNNPLCKAASAFGLKSNTLECPFCERTFGIGGAMNEHLRAMHKADGRVKLFGCNKCFAWYNLPSNAVSHHRKKGCKLRIRTVDEAKNCNSLHQKKDGDDSEEDEKDLNEDDTGEDEKPAYENMANNEEEEE